MLLGPQTRQGARRPGTPPPDAGRADPDRTFELERRLPLKAAGDSPIYLRVTLEDGHQDLVEPDLHLSRLEAGMATEAALEPRRPDNLLPYDGEVRFYPGVIPASEADRLYAALTEVTPWRQETATVMGRRLPIPRLTAWHGARGYVYSGIRMEPAPWSEPLLRLKRIAQELAGQEFNSVLLNLYRNGRDSVSWHADNEPGLGRDPVIASVSLGASRRFQLRHRRTKESISLDLLHGSCLVMAGATQHHWLHQIPKTARAVGPRINLTFRRMS